MCFILKIILVVFHHHSCENDYQKQGLTIPHGSHNFLVLQMHEIFLHTRNIVDYLECIGSCSFNADVPLDPIRSDSSRHGKYNIST